MFRWYKVRVCGLCDWDMSDDCKTVQSDISVVINDGEGQKLDGQAEANPD